MVEVSIRIPDELRKPALMKKINWQLAVSRKLNEELERLARVERIIAKSELSEKDVQELTDETNMALAERYERLLKSKRT